MFYQFERFLVVKVAERVQQLSRHKCLGCVSGYSLDQLHLCMSVPLPDRITLFLPRAKHEAFTKVENLLRMYQQNAWAYDEQAFIEGGRLFIKKLTVDHLIDRRYVNEDTTMEHPFNTTWLADEEVFLASQVEQQFELTLAPILPLDPGDEKQQITPIKKTKKKKKDC